MKKVYIFLFIILFSTNLFAYKRVSVPFKVGEYMEYEVRVFKASVAKLKVWVKDIVTIDKRECYYIYADVETMPWVSKIYHLHDKINAYIDKESLYPYKILTKIKEGNWTNTVNIDIDRNRKELHYVDKRSDKILKYTGEVLGLVSLIYYARTMEPNKGEKITFTLSNGDKIIYVDTVVKSTSDSQYVPELKKRFNAILYEQIGGRNVALWIATDKHRLPIRMISVRLKLAGYGITNIESWLTKFKP